MFKWNASPDTVSLQAEWGSRLREAVTARVTTATLGRARVPGLGYENPDGSALEIGSDFLGNPRSKTRPTPGPLEGAATGEKALKLR